MATWTALGLRTGRGRHRWRFWSETESTAGPDPRLLRKWKVPRVSDREKKKKGGEGGSTHSVRMKWSRCDLDVDRR